MPPPRRSLPRPARACPGDPLLVLKQNEDDEFGEYWTRRLVLAAWERQHHRRGERETTVSENRPRRPKINWEPVAYWFFRLNGCLTIPNFVVHPDRRGSQRTDADVVAVRFPYRRELLTSGKPMIDHPMFGQHGRIDIIIAEVKTGECRLNGPWTRPGDKNMNRVLYALGVFPEITVPEVADALYSHNRYENAEYLLRLVAIGATRNDQLPDTVTQLEWAEILSSIHDRFQTFRAVKAHHPQWDGTGRQLYRLATTMNEADFADQVLGGR